MAEQMKLMNSGTAMTGRMGPGADRALLYVGFGRPGERRRPPRETPLEVLQRRLANGEITPQQYEERKTLLDRNGGGEAEPGACRQ